ncbi:bifunctional pantoate--beta-alanine ligase/(d)CMP kinase [Synechococcus sp. CCY 9618]|uniref:bifunctional pantoate--beta-alanine ligase/(d)CMP kinase n=1 Tax=Synechococcus sp. CCY 9618 TaxID=2815602 RepID=UPI001C210F9E
MRLLQTRAELAAWRQEQVGRLLHFVPTMGSLHGGHQQLLRRAAEPVSASRPAVLLSVFVNPLQFAPGEDFARYPRDLAADAALGEAAGACALFAPAPEELFPGGPGELTRVIPPVSLQETLCGPGRPGHFEGVATVVCRLLALVRPDRLLLGEKDWQQLTILRRVVADLALPLTVQGCATVREADGLACSSRLRYLSACERRQASAVREALASAFTLWRGGTGSAAALTGAVGRHLEAAGLAAEYVQLVHPSTLRPVAEADGLSLLAVAARCGNTRLIDHVFLMNRAPIVAIDGPAGAGKSTVTRAFARRLGLLYLDTGAMYRALTWWVRERGVDPTDPGAVAPLLEGLDLQLVMEAGGEQRVRVNGHEVSEAIRSPEVTALVSTVAAHACVREALTRQQQAMGQQGGLVAEGRDIGTAVFPDADCKVFLTATVAERARRRSVDLAQRGFAVPDLADLEAQIAERDHLDSSRPVAPLRQAADAVELVTDGLGIDAVIQRLVDLFRERVPEDAWPGPTPIPVP